MDPKKPDRFRVREIEVEKLVLRERNGGRIRAVVETGPPRAGMDKPELPTVRLSLLDGRGEARLIAEVDAEGTAALFVGGPDKSPMVVLTPHSVDVWSRGNVVASVRSEEGTGVVELLRGAARGPEPASRPKKSR